MCMCFAYVSICLQHIQEFMHSSVTHSLIKHLDDHGYGVSSGWIFWANLVSRGVWSISQSLVHRVTRYAMNCLFCKSLLRKRILYTPRILNACLELKMLWFSRSVHLFHGFPKVPLSRLLGSWVSWQKCKWKRYLLRFSILGCPRKLGSMVRISGL